MKWEQALIQLNKALLGTDDSWHGVRYVMHIIYNSTNRNRAYAVRYITRSRWHTINTKFVFLFVSVGSTIIRNDTTSDVVADYYNIRRVFQREFSKRWTDQCFW
jgi:hypothetical protein